MDNFCESYTKEKLSSLCWVVLFPHARSVLNELSSIDFICVCGSCVLLFLCGLHCHNPKAHFFGKASKKWDLDTFVMRLVKNV